MIKPIYFLQAPSNLGLKPPAADRVPGTFRAPEALIRAGLSTRLQAQGIGVVTAGRYMPEIDPATGIRNVDAIRRFTLKLARTLEPLLADYFPLVVGGDCSVLIGAMLAMKRAGRCGLIFMDGHTDFLTPETSATGGAAGMDLAIVTGYGADKLTDIDRQKPYVRESNVVVFGNRDIEAPETYPAKLIFETDISMITLTYARQVGVEMAAMQAVELLKQRGVDGFWIHLDADVLDSALMPAVDSPLPDGLTYDDLITVLRALLQTGLAFGMDITIYDPDLDPTGHIARAYVDALVAALLPV